MDLLKPNDVAKMLAVSRAWVYEAAKDGRIPSVRIGGEEGPLRFVPEDIERWLADARAAWSPGRRLRRGSRDSGTPRNRSRPRGSTRPARAAEQQSLL